MQFTYNSTEFKLGKANYYAITGIKNETRKKAENPQVINHELKETINRLIEHLFMLF